MTENEYLEMPWSIEDTIENLNEIKENFKVILINKNLDGKASDDVKELEFDFDREINALEKQIPKKPQKSQSKLRYLGTYVCPSCGGDFSGTGVASYCYHCGQRFKWNNAEDWSDGE